MEVVPDEDPAKVGPGPMDDSEGSGRKKKLTSAGFDNLLRRLDPDRACAAAEYENLRWQLRRFFEWNCGSDPEELVDETLDRLAQKLEAEEIRDVVPFAWGIARNIRLEANRRAARLRPIMDSPESVGFRAHATDVEDGLNATIDQERKLKCLRICIQRLSEYDRRLLVAYYQVTEDAATVRARLALTLGLKMNALRVRVNRLRDRVERCATRCLSSSAGKASHLGRM